MKINIITIHAMHNPGSVLQAYALQKYLSSSNNEVKIIDYCPDYFYKEEKSLKYMIKKYLYYKSYQSRSKKFNDFIMKNMQLSSRYHNYDELKKANLIGDVFIVGSDQLWNSDYKCGKDISFYLKFVRRGRKISYSTSVGKELIDEESMKILKDNLSDFEYLSVREKSTSKQLSKLLNRTVEFVCDPVFLLEENEYKEFIRPNKTLNKPYVMVYLAPKSDVLDRVVKMYKDQGLEIKLVGGFSKRCYCDTHIKEVGPEEFLTYIYNAEVVISTSFHATAFAHVFHKNFFAILPKRNGERIKSLLHVSGLEGRVIKEGFDTKDLCDSIQWDEVDERIENYKDNSKKYLKIAIENNKGAL